MGTQRRYQRAACGREEGDTAARDDGGLVQCRAEETSSAVRGELEVNSGRRFGVR
jgi:hypothetical protein